MQFNSIGRSSNFAQAGKSAADDTLKSFIASRRNAPDYGKIVKEGMENRSAEKRAAIQTSAQVHKAGIKAKSGIKAYGIEQEAKRGLKQSQRKAGALGAAGKMFGGIANAGGEKPLEPYKGRQSREEINADIDKYTTEAESIRAGIVVPEKPDFSTPDKAGGTGASSTSSSKGGSNISSIANGSYTGSLDDLSDDDKKWISYAVSSEAAMGTDDEFGVAGVLINRMRSGNYPTSAYNVAHQKGQFEGVEIGNSVHDQKLYDRLFSGQGLQKLEGALTTLDGRDSFKGQALLHNRSSKGNKDGKLDPMFHSSGNFFHHSYQT